MTDLRGSIPLLIRLKDSATNVTEPAVVAEPYIFLQTAMLAPL